jgi:hypothetical protein
MLVEIDAGINMSIALWQYQAGYEEWNGHMVWERFKYSETCAFTPGDCVW